MSDSDLATESAHLLGAAPFSFCLVGGLSFRVAAKPGIDPCSAGSAPILGRSYFPYASQSRFWEAAPSLSCCVCCLLSRRTLFLLKKRVWFRAGAKTSSRKAAETADFSSRRLAVLHPFFGVRGCG